MNPKNTRTEPPELVENVIHLKPCILVIDDNAAVSCVSL